jgi:hypothetical protein
MSILEAKEKIKFLESVYKRQLTESEREIASVCYMYGWDEGRMELINLASKQWSEMNK